MYHLQLVARSETGTVTHRQETQYADAADVLDHILCQQNNPQTRYLEIVLNGERLRIDLGMPSPQRKHHPRASFARETRRIALAEMAMMDGGRG